VSQADKQSNNHKNRVERERDARPRHSSSALGLGFSVCCLLYPVPRSTFSHSFRDVEASSFFLPHDILFRSAFFF